MPDTRATEWRTRQPAPRYRFIGSVALRRRSTRQLVARTRITVSWLFINKTEPSFLGCLAGQKNPTAANWPAGVMALRLARILVFTLHPFLRKHPPIPRHQSILLLINRLAIGFPCLTPDESLGWDYLTQEVGSRVTICEFLFIFCLFSCVYVSIHIKNRTKSFRVINLFSQYFVCSELIFCKLIFRQ